jgi:Icc-related predicted phosphoesterase
MRILAIGDPHGALAKIKNIQLASIDLILLTGDLGKADLARKQSFENWDRKQKGLPELKSTAKQVRDIHNEIHTSTLDILKYLSKRAPVYTLQGNVGIPTVPQVRKSYEKHNISLPITRQHVDAMLNVSLIKNRLRLLAGLRVGFLEYFTDTCWVREFKPKEYQKAMKKAKLETDKAKSVLERFGDNLDVLVCHQPPFGFLDKVTWDKAPKEYQGKHAGSKAILDYIKKHQPKFVFCGHIHEGEGFVKIGKTEIYNLGVAGHKIVEL